MRIPKDRARAILLREAEEAKGSQRPEEGPWVAAVESLSRTCEGSARTHIAFLGTALLAKATDLKVDPFAVKAGAGTPGAYSARGLGHGVLVPLAPKLGIDLGVSGREPLNNQPYFRISRFTHEEVLPLVKDDGPARELVRILERVSLISTAAEASLALRAFIRVRRRHVISYPAPTSYITVTSIADLGSRIDAFVLLDSEGGKRAQASAAGLFDSIYGHERIVTTRVNDPDRHLPGDVGVLHSEARQDRWERVLEVRDKPVSEEDLYLFSDKALRARVWKASVLGVAPNQPEFSPEGVIEWAWERGLVLSTSWSWRVFLRQLALWSSDPYQQILENSPKMIRTRLVELEVSVAGVFEWDRLTSASFRT
jgi:hypothetical protein